MSDHRIQIEGVLYLSLETYAQTFQVEVAWMRELFDRGLLGPSAPAARYTCISITQMDRVATSVRLHQGYGLDVEAIAWMLEEDEE